MKLMLILDLNRSSLQATGGKFARGEDVELQEGVSLLSRWHDPSFRKAWVVVDAPDAVAIRRISLSGRLTRSSMTRKSARPSRRHSSPGTFTALPSSVGGDVGRGIRRAALPTRFGPLAAEGGHAWLFDYALRRWRHGRCK
ncbi:MAG: DUF3303 family protein [Hyphomicrobiaceae bacterium]